MKANCRLGRRPERRGDGRRDFEADDTRTDKPPLAAETDCFIIVVFDRPGRETFPFAQIAAIVMRRIQTSIRRNAAADDAMQ